MKSDNGDLLILGFLVFGMLFSFYFTWSIMSLRPPDNPNPDCSLEIGEHTLQGNATNIRERISQSGNKYYLFTIVTSAGCEYPAFSFQDPTNLSSFQGVWKYNQFNQLQFDLGWDTERVSYPSPEEDMIGEIKLAKLP